MNKYDVIIIGAGLGGLTAGAKLCKAGKKVIIIEQGEKPGGCSATFRRLDYTIEATLHEIDGFDKIDPKAKIFQDLGITDHVHFVKIPQFYRFTNTRVNITIHNNPIKTISLLSSLFPHEIKGIKKFFEVILGIRKEMYTSPMEQKIYTFTYYSKSLGEFLDSIIKNEDLKLALQANLQFYHDDPYTLSLIYFALAQGNYYCGGSYYIQGGSQKLINYLAEFIKNNGGKILLSHTVNRIINKHKKATAVYYCSSLSHNKMEEKVTSDHVIVNSNIPDVANKLLNPKSENLKLKIRNLDISCSLSSVYICLNKTFKEIGNSCYSTYFFDENIHNQSDLKRNNHGLLSKKNFSFIDYSQIDAQLTKPGKSTGTICFIDYLSNWGKLNFLQYNEQKNIVADSFVKRLNKIIPCSQSIEYFESSTPKTIKKYTKNPMGTCYGFAQTPLQFGIKRISQKSPIENLYFASAWTRPGGGFSSTICSGYICAEQILNNKNK